MAGLAAAVPQLEEFLWEELDVCPDRFAVARRHRETPWRRKAHADQCQSDFCVEAAKLLLGELAWKPEEIDLIVMATLTPDYPIPATAIIIQDRLGLSKSAAAFDLPSGGLGFLHGLQVVASMLSTGGLKRALLLTGEVSKTPESSDAGTPHRAVHGHSGSVCALEHLPGSPAMLFDACGDGSTFEALYMPVGGVRNPPRPEMFENSEGIKFASDYVLDASVLGTTATREIPASVHRVLDAARLDIADVDECYSNPLAMPVEEAIRKDLGIARDRFHSWIPEFGASGSGSIPLAMLARGASRLRQGRRSSLLCGIGPGLAWGSAVLTTDGMVCPDILEV
jgi:3-oxoacyl-[acyl-carrier-protein] synthase-3